MTNNNISKINELQ
jgi:hypothetical protein